MNKIFIISVFLLIAFAASSQTEYGDFVYEKKAIKERKIVPYPPLREADVMYLRRVWRIVDSREKMNVIMNWPKSPFWRIIYESATTGYGGAPITAYRNDSLLSFYTAEELLTRGGEEKVEQYAPDPDYPDFLIDTTIYLEFKPRTIVRYKIMEDWVFDKQRSNFYPRIIAIAPMYVKTIQGEVIGEEELFWAKWEDIKKILVNQEIFNRHNDATRFTYLDWFELRMFTSYVSKEANAFDYAIAEFEEFKTNPFDALLEAEKIKDKLFMWEHSLWQW